MKGKRMVSILLILTMLAALLSVGVAAVDACAPEDPGQSWTTSKSKTAEGLDSHNEAKVTLSVPSAQEQLVSDVVFVLDKSTSTALTEQALNMLAALKDQIQETGARVKVGVVIFDREAHVSNSGNFMDLETDYEAIETAITQKLNSGTNTHAGLLAGKAMLDADTEVSASRKHLIFVSDGITYIYNEEPTATAWTFYGDAWLNWAGPDNWNSKYHTNDAPKSWDDWLTDIAGKVEAQGTTYEYPYGGTVTEATPQENWDTAYANSIDKALYLTNQVYQELVAEGYHCYAVRAETKKGKQYTWGPSFMDYLSGGRTVDFTTIQNDILYLLGPGSTVVDTMGADFDFVNDPAKLTLTVGETAYPAEQIGENHYGFGKQEGGSYLYELTYAPETDSFTWLFCTNAMNFTRTSLTYSVKLVHKETEPGTYTVPTNESAILTPVDSAQNEGAPEEFEIPEVSYVVPVPMPVTGNVRLTKTDADSGDALKGAVFDLYTAAGRKVATKTTNQSGQLNVFGLYPGKYYFVELTAPAGYLLDKSQHEFSVSAGCTTKVDVTNKRSTVPDCFTSDHYAYIIGYPDDTVQPQGNITRAEVATIFFRLLSEETRAANLATTNSFSDVSQGMWFNTAISTLEGMGILNGYEDDTFRPDAYITRAELVKIAASFDEKGTDGGNPFEDAGNHWAAEYIALATENGWINGYEDQTFKPDQYITRAETMAVVNRVLQRLPRSKADLLPGMITWPDNMDESAWYYLYVQEATNGHTYERINGSEHWTDWEETPDWKQYER